MNFDVFIELRSEFAENAARVNHGARAIGRRLVPDGRQSEDGPGIAGTQRADDQVVHLRTVLHHLHVFTLTAGVAEFGDGGGRVGEETLFVGLVDPGASHYARSVARTDLGFVAVN